VTVAVIGGIQTDLNTGYFDEFGNALPTVAPGDIIMEDPNTGSLINVMTGEVVRAGTKTVVNTGTGTGGSGGSGGSSATSATIKGWFEYYYGSAPSGLMAQADAANWTEQDVINRAIADGKTSAGLNILRDAIRKSSVSFYGGDPTAIPASLIDSLIREGYWTSDGLNYLQNTYFPQLRGVDATNPLASDWVAKWTDMTGRSMGSTAMTKMQEIVRAYGFTDVGLAAWENWIKTTDSAYTGNWGAEHRADIQTGINTILGRGATEEELSLKGSMWNLNDEALLEAIRATDEYAAIYSGKPAWLSETEYISEIRGYDWVLRSYYGDQTVLNEDGSLTIPQGPYYQEPSSNQNAPVPTSNPDKAVEWKKLDASTFAQELAKIGITATGSGATGTYTDAQGNKIAFDELGSLLPSGQFYKDAQGYHYVQAPGAVNPKTGAVTPGLATATPTTEAAPYSGGLSNWGVSYVTTDMADLLIANNITPDHLAQQFAWTEEAAYYEGVYGGMLSETGMGGGIDFYKVASGAQGSGAMRAQLMQAQNAYAFKEAFHTYTGRNPSAGDYDFLTSNFVSPNEYAKTMAAYESAEAKLPEINDVLERVIGKSLSVTDVQDMVLGREGSGSTQALLTQAMKLDAFTWAFKQDQGRNPTPQEYASFAGYTGPEELVWKITTRERIAENAPVIQALWRDVYKRELTAEEMQTLFGEQAGSGALKAQWTAAQKQQKEKESTEEATQNAPRAITPFVAASQGGFQVGVKPLPMS
jgi:hypothetical protein